ncbi:MAG: ADP-ribosylglycohydrolase family protein [Clostridia bacterium]|nr:ADP-ribosylglycohydrolase family protein [Clostridia bacterium]
MFGALYGDVIGSYYELRCTKEYDFEMFQPISRFTDDSVLTAAVCEVILENPAEVGFFGLNARAAEFAVKYRQFYARYPDAGYGGMFSAWARGKGPARVRSYGNGAAMRAVPFGYAYKDIEQIKLQVKASCLYTHRNREAIRGAQAVAVAVRMALDGASKAEIRAFV